MSDWQVGDLAVCVDDSPCQCRSRPGVGCPLVVGKVYRVLRVRAAQQVGNPAHRWTNLLLENGPTIPGHRKEGAWGAHRFRKIRPDEQESCEPEFVTLLNRIKRKVSA